MATRNGNAVWNGNLKEGNGEVTVGDGVFSGSYSFASRFEEGEGTNPEELIAAAHAACYSMAFANILSEAGHVPDSIATTARVQLRPLDGKPTIAEIRLEVEGSVPGIEREEFLEHAEAAKAGCPVSRALAGVPEIVLDAKLTS
ncbi:MAG: OsmC family protein [Solirubrobacterales bacterium]